MNHLCKQILAIFISVCLLGSLLSGCKKQSDQEKFNELINDIFVKEATQDSLSLHYLLSHPENYGIKIPNTTLGDFSLKQMKKDLSASEDSLKRLTDIDCSGLDKESQTTYYILKDSLEKTIACKDFLFMEEALGPVTGLQAQLPILFAEYAFTTKDDIKEYIKILNCTKDYFQQICDFEIEKSNAGYFMSDEVADAIILQCQDFIKDPENNLLISYFEEKIHNRKDLTEKEKLLFSEQNRDAILKSVIPAYESIITTLTQLKGSSINPKGLCGFDNGQLYYELKAQRSTGSSKSIPQMKQVLKEALNKSLAVMTTLSIKDPTLYEQYKTMSFPSEDPTEIMEYLAAAIETDFPAVDSVPYSVKYVHKSLQDHLSPAMYIVPPIDDCTNNNIYINNLPSYDMARIFPTVAHEGYPGHLYQNVYFTQQKKHPIRSLINITGYDEGWATYVECYSYGLAKLKTPLAQFLQANMIAVHCLYSLTDIGIHYDGWSREKTTQFWMNYVDSEEEAENIYTMILAEPGVYLSYSIGYLEIVELRALAKQLQGDSFTLKNFHEFLLDFGPAPFDLIRQELQPQ